jgi:hypothetical protein
MHRSNASKLLAWLVMAATPLLNSCSPQVRILRVSSPASDYEVKELHVTGRPIVAKHDFYPTLRIEGFNKPNGDPYYIDSPVADDEFLTKLDPQKTYRFHLFTTDQTRGPNDHIHHAILSKVEADGTCVIDASLCDVHHQKMEFVPAQNESWSLSSPKERRDLERFHNHGRAFPSCCSGGLIRWYTWRCPACSRKVDAFQSKFDP